jgi:2,4-dienoyl-CoA reductase-like NADH-dependent reductase (Old Yellow Enzyme family)
MSALFSPLRIRDVEFPNRIVVSPMCQYSSEDGLANDWHLVHLGTRAVGGAGAILVEASGVEARGRISPGDMGIWKDAHIEPLARIARFLRSRGTIAGVQIAHAGRKASTQAPWEGGRAIALANGGWETIAPSAIPFREGDPAPQEMSLQQIAEVREAFAAAARRVLAAGFDLLEIHAAHGYLLHEFYSPLSNRRSDEYGGSFENRTRMLLEVTAAVREVWPERLPLFVRVSATDWVDGGWDADQTVRLAKVLKDKGVDLIDCSSGGAVAHAQIPVAPGYQVPFAERVKKETGILSAAVGMITEPQQAEDIIAAGKADFVLLAREMLRRPYWALEAAKALGVKPTPPVQYGRAF